MPGVLQSLCRTQLERSQQSRCEAFWCTYMCMCRKPPQLQRKKISTIEIDRPETGKEREREEREREREREREECQVKAVVSSIHWYYYLSSSISAVSGDSVQCATPSIFRTPNVNAKQPSMSWHLAQHRAAFSFGP